MLKFSTDDLPEGDRFAHWREVRAKTIFGVTVEMESQKQKAFRGRFSGYAVGGASLVEMHASSYRVHRTHADIDRAPGDSFCIYQQIDGACWFDAGRNGEFIVKAGGLATSHSDRPYLTTPTTDRGFHLRLVKIPFERCSLLIRNGDDLAARPLAGEPGIVALFSTYFDAFVTQAPSLEGVDAEIAVQTLTQLAIAARGLVPTAEEESRAAIRNARLQTAQQLIDRDLHRPDLSASRVAGILGISVRHLHLLFEPTGSTFSRTVMARRLERARQQLMHAPGKPVADVAFACGFESLATFYRAFRATYGHTPNDLREASLNR